MIELNKIYCESNLDTLSRMPDEFLDLTVTSPPYDNLRTYNGYSWDFDKLAPELFRVTKKGGVVVWVVCDKTVDGDETGTSFAHALRFKGVGFQLTDTMIYAKNNPIPGDCGQRYRQSFEYMFVFSKGRSRVFNALTVLNKPTSSLSYFRLEKDGRKTYEGTREAPTDRRRNNIFFYTVGGDVDARGHSAPFPEQLAKDHIHSWSNPGDLVYDCFMGSGTTAKAAHQLGRNWIGSEISQEYVDLANKRLEPYLAQSNLFEQKQ
jgi:DNA modification methylase